MDITTAKTGRFILVSEIEAIILDVFDEVKFSKRLANVYVMTTHITKLPNEWQY